MEIAWQYLKVSQLVYKLKCAYVDVLFWIKLHYVIINFLLDTH